MRWSVVACLFLVSLLAGVRAQDFHSARYESMDYGPFLSLSLAGNFKDPRPSQRGDLPRDWLRYRGIYRCGRDCVLSYTVGDAEVLEAPRAKKYAEGSGVDFARVFNVGPTRNALTLLVCER